MKVNARRKGAETELKVAKVINDVLGSNVKRTPRSGAYLEMAGDIMTFGDADSITNDWLWEVKNRNTGFTGLLKWWKKAREETPIGKRTVVIATTDREDYYAFITLKDFLYLLKVIQGYDT